MCARRSQSLSFKPLWGVSQVPRNVAERHFYVNPFVATLSGKREEGRLFSGSRKTWPVSSALTHSLWYRGPQRKSLQKRRHSESIPGRLNAVNSSVGFSAANY